MKHMLFGCTLILSGVIAAMGWINACVGLVQPGSRSSVGGCLDPGDWVIVALCLTVAVIGLVFAVRSLRTGKKHNTSD